MRLLALALLALAACADSPDAAAAADAPVRVDGAPWPDAQQCNALDIGPAPVVTVMQVAAAPPVEMGGTIVDGTYFLTTDTIYTGAGGATGPLPVSGKLIIEIRGDVLNAVSADGAGNNIVRSTRTIRPYLPTLFNETITCPTTGPDRVEHYTATPTSLSFYSRSEVSVFARQP